MPADEYASTIRGGLKLKGGAPTGIKKKKKKPKINPTSASSSSSHSNLQKALEDEDKNTPSSKSVTTTTKNDIRTSPAEPGDGVDDLRELEERDNSGKTPAEKALEETRRKRLHERLQKEGVKTHKQRVEELNKYLSNLSEHHDMPRIGPG